MDEKKWWFAGTALMAVSLVWFVGCEKMKGQAPSVSKGVVATVNNHTITEADVETRISRMPPNYQQALKGRKKELVDDMILEELLYDEAKRRGLQNDKETKEMMEEAQKRVLIASMLKDAVDGSVTVTDKEAEDSFNAEKDRYQVPERWRVSHILVKTEQEAKELLDQLSKGKSFEELAKAKSQDTTASRGGDLGYFTKGQLAPEFENAAVKLEPGQTSDVVKTEFGYHIIRLTDHKPAQAQGFETVKDRIKNDLLNRKRREAFSALSTELKKKASIKINEDMLAPPKKTPAPADSQEPGVNE